MRNYTLTSAQYPALVFHYVIDGKRLKYTTQQQNVQYCRSECAAHRQRQPHLLIIGGLVASWSKLNVRRSAARS